MDRALLTTWPVKAALATAGITAAIAIACGIKATAAVPLLDGGAPAASLASLGLEGPDAVATPLADGGAAPQPHVTSIAFEAPIFSASEFPPKDPTRASDERLGVVRLGYLRKGGSVPVKPGIIKKGNCPEGWYALLAGGFVCGKFVTDDPANKELLTAPHPPLTEGPLPYEYGLNLTNGTPLYRRLPKRSERTELEKGLAVGRTRHKDKDGKAKSEESDDTAHGPPVDPDAPWYLQPHHGQKPQLSFEELHDNGSGLVELRMVRGFYVALDRPIEAHAGKFFRSTRGMFVPGDHLLVHQPKTEFEGVWLDDQDPKKKLPLALVNKLHGHEFEKRDDETHFRRGDPIPRFTLLSLTGVEGTEEEHRFYQTSESWWLRDVDFSGTKPGPVPKDIGPDEKWIDVNLTKQSLVAFVGAKPVFATFVSTGRRSDDPAKDHKTVTGSFRIREKHVAATMADDGNQEGPYSIEDVPWIMYFHNDFALHGAFWHSSFGHERSHGCVNLNPHDAKELFQWSDPKLPEGWHGIRSTEANPGTRVVVHE